MMFANLKRTPQLAAMLFIAFGAVSMPAAAQNNVQMSAELAAERAERSRISQERAALQKSLAEQREACYQKFAVTPCLNKARDEHNEKTLDLKRQELLLSDAQRKRAAAVRVSAMDERNSPAAQLARAQDRGRALEAAARRDVRQAQRQNEREKKQKALAAQPMRSDEIKLDKDRERLAPQVDRRQQPMAPVAPEQRTGQAQRSLKKAQRSADRERVAQLRRNKAAEREASRKKPPAASLPMQMQMPMPTQAK